jgi:transketolase
VGEDGPTHQPVEHVDSLRIIPGLHVVRPADARETVAAWGYALRRQAGPTALVLTRQSLPVLERPSGGRVPAAVGLSGVAHEPARPPVLVLVASGSEVALGIEAARRLDARDIAVRVVSVPCLEELAAAPADAVDRLLPPALPRLFLEAGTGWTWGEWMRTGDAFHGIRRFGASAPGGEVAKRLGMDPDEVARHVRSVLR